DRHLVLGEAPGLEQDRIGDRDLSEIVKHATLVQQLAVIAAEPEKGPDLLRIPADTLGVVDRVAVARLDGAREGVEDILRRVEPRHVDVEEDEIRLDLGDRLESLDAVLGLADVVTEIAKYREQQLAIRREIVDDEDRGLSCDDEGGSGHAAVRVWERTALSRSWGEMGLVR